jgi:hypothetical protein
VTSIIYGGGDRCRGAGPNALSPLSSRDGLEWRGLRFSMLKGPSFLMRLNEVWIAYKVFFILLLISKPLYSYKYRI